MLNFKRYELQARTSLGEAQDYVQSWIQSDGTEIGRAGFDGNLTYPLQIKIPGRILTWQGEGDIAKYYGGQLVSPLRFTLTMYK